jgi:hypothetical protein
MNHPKFRSARAFVAALAATTACAAPSSGAPAVPPSPAPLREPASGFPTTRIGANSYLLGGSGRNFEFPDQYRHARPGSANGLRDGLAPLGPDGWPTGDFSLSLFFTVAGVANLGGVYTISFESASAPSVTLLTPGTLSPFTLNASTGRWEGAATLPNSPGDFNLRFTGVTSPVRNIRVLRPGFTGNENFVQPWLGTMNRWSSLRFMGWTNTNNSSIINWTDGNAPGFGRWGIDTAGGVPWEVCVDLANTLNRDMWVTIPHRATNAYVAQLAALIRDNLAPGRRVFVEWSNELWNFSFQQASWNRQQALNEVALGNSNLNYDGELDPRFWWTRRVAKRTLEIADIFESTMGPGSRNTRFLPVLAGRCWLTDELSDSLKYIEANYGPPRNLIHSIAVAPYIYINFGDEPAGPLTKDQILDFLQTDLNNLAENANFEAFRALAAWYGLSLDAYEAGVDTAGPNNLPAKGDAHRDPRMRQIIRDYLTLMSSWGFEEIGWSAWGAGTFASPFGAWGLSDDITTVNTSPKALGIDDVRLAPPPAPTGGTPVPGVIDARRHAFRSPNWAQGVFLIMTAPGQSRDYVVRVDGVSPRTIAIWPRSATVQPGGVPMGGFINGAPIGTVRVPESGNDAVFVETSPFVVTLQPGWHTFRFVQNGPGQVNTGSFRLGCPGDYNADQVRNPADIFFFLNLYFAGSLRADFTGDGVRTPQDIFSFLNAYFAGC